MDRVAFDIRRAGVAYAARAAKLLGRWNFTNSRVDVFVIHSKVLAQHGVVLQTDLRARLGISRSTMSLMLTRLERRGFIERRRAEHDRRNIVVIITALGRAVFDELVSRVGPTLFTPYVDTQLWLHDLRTSVAVQRARILQHVGAIRELFGDSSRAPYPP